MELKIVKNIEEPEFGCEGRNDNKPAMSKVYLQDDIVIEMPDSTLYQLEIYEDMEVIYDEEKKLVYPKELSLNENTYEIIKLLGKGKGGYSFLARKNDEKYVLKQIHHEPCEYYQFGDKIASEKNDYERLKNAGINIPRLLEIDNKTERILKEYIEGDTVFDYVKNDMMQEKYIEKMREMLPNIYGLNLNIDYFPTNFVVQNDELYYIDFECNNYMDEWNFENWGIKYWSKTDEFLDYLRKG